MPHSGDKKGHQHEIFKIINTAITKKFVLRNIVVFVGFIVK